MGWHYEPKKTVEVERLAVQLKAFPVVKIDHRVFRISVKPRELRPIKEYWDALLRLEPWGRLD